MTNGQPAVKLISRKHNTTQIWKRSLHYRESSKECDQDKNKSSNKDTKGAKPTTDKCLHKSQWWSSEIPYHTYFNWCRQDHEDGRQTLPKTNSSHILATTVWRQITTMSATTTAITDSSPRGIDQWEGGGYICNLHWKYIWQGDPVTTWLPVVDGLMIMQGKSFLLDIEIWFMKFNVKYLVLIFKPPLRSLECYHPPPHHRVTEFYHPHVRGGLISMTPLPKLLINVPLQKIMIDP